MESDKMKIELTKKQKIKKEYAELIFELSKCRSRTLQLEAEVNKYLDKLEQPTQAQENMIFEVRDAKNHIKKAMDSLKGE